MSKRRKKRIWILLLAVLGCGVIFGCCVLAGRYRAPQIIRQDALSFSSGQVQVEQTQTRAWFSDLTLLRRQYQLTNNDLVTFGRLRAGKDGLDARPVEEYQCSDRQATVYFLDPQTGECRSAAIGPMRIDSTCIYVDGQTQDYFFYPPVSYRLLERATIQDAGGRGFLAISEHADGYRLSLYAPALEQSCCGDYTVVRSGGTLLDLPQQRIGQDWIGKANYAARMWCYDGYYHPSPENYVPGGENCYYRCAASYLIDKFLSLADTCRVAEDLCPAMLDTVAAVQNDAGYFPTEPQSGWLAEDYGIGAGFYDTRFNSDLMMYYLKYCRQNGGFSDVIDRYFAFYLEFAQNNQRQTRNGGCLVYDYYGPDMSSPPHTSLNHQLSEMEVLYEFSDFLQRPELAELADRMLLGLEDTADGWIREDSDLNYCYFDDGSFGKQDYPYLTYNDLYRVQLILQRRRGVRSEALDRLMQAKRAWMDANQITEYLH